MLNLRKSLFTSILPILCITGAIVLGLMWNNKPIDKSKQKIQIEGPKMPPMFAR